MHLTRNILSSRLWWPRGVAALFLEVHVPMMPVSKHIRHGAGRLTGAISLVLILGLTLTGRVALGAPGASHEPNTDTVAFRTALPSPAVVNGINEVSISVGTAGYSRDLIDWIAFNGSDHTPAAGPELNRVDVLQLTNGTQVLGRLVSLSRTEALIDTGSTQTIPFSQVSAVLFCDTPCLVSPGVAVDPLVIATESARISAAGGKPVAAAAVVAAPSDPLAAIRGQVQPPQPTPTSPPPPTATPTTPPIPTPVPTALVPPAVVPPAVVPPAVVPPAPTPAGIPPVPNPIFPVPQLITGTPVATAASVPILPGP